MSTTQTIPNPPSSSGGTTPRPDIFATTRWSVVLAAARRDTTRAREALEHLCCTYWQPLYAYVRRQGRTKEDAEDLVQGFFARFLERNDLAGLDRERGRFRAFLLASLKHYLANEWDRAHRQKRGGHATHLPLDWQTAEARYLDTPADHASPDIVFDREWALTLLSHVLARLEKESVAEGKAAMFAKLRVYLTAGRTEIPYAQAAVELGIDEGATRVAVHRLRKRYRTLVRDEIAQTLASPEQVDEEMQALFAALSS